MNYASLEDHAPKADALGRSILGFTIRYTIGGRVFAPKVQGDLADGQIAGIGSQAIAQEAELMILKIDLPAMPNASHRIVLPQRPADTWQPINVASDETGRHWLMNLKRAPV